MGEQGSRLISSLFLLVTGGPDSKAGALKNNPREIQLCCSTSVPYERPRTIAEAKMLIAWSAIWRINCAVYGGFVRDYIVRGENANDVDVLLVNGNGVTSVMQMLGALCSEHGWRVGADRKKGLADCATVTCGQWDGPIEVDLVDPQQVKQTSPAPHVDSDAGNLMVDQKGLHLKVGNKNLPTLSQSIAHVRAKEFVVLYDTASADPHMCRQRIDKYLKRGWVCLTQPSAQVCALMGGDVKKYRSQIRPDVQFDKKWWQ